MDWTGWVYGGILAASLVPSGESPATFVPGVMMF